MELAKLFLGDALADVMELDGNDMRGLEKIGLDFYGNDENKNRKTSQSEEDLLQSDTDGDQAHRQTQRSELEDLHIREREFCMPQKIMSSKYGSIYRLTQLFMPENEA